MKYLLDTQVLIWWFESSEKLPPEIKEIIEDESIKMVSVVSFWEIIIKIKIKKLRLKRSLDYLVKNLEFKVLDININHILRLNKLKDFHKDPFDRILIAQSIEENCTLLTTDKTIKKYLSN